MQDAIAEEHLSANGPHSAAVFTTTFVDINGCSYIQKTIRRLNRILLEGDELVKEFNMVSQDLTI